MNKPWPINPTETVHFDDLAAPLRAAFLALYDMERKGKKGTKWTGLDIGKRMKAGCFSPDHELSTAGLAAHDDQGRDALDALIQVALQTGMEQGERMVRDRQKAMLGLALSFANDRENPNPSLAEVLELVKKS